MIVRRGRPGRDSIRKDAIAGGVLLPKPSAPPTNPRCQNQSVSWDVSLMSLPTDAASIIVLPQDVIPAPFGSRAEVVSKLQRAAPAGDFSDPAWGHINGAGFSIEVNIGEDDPVESIMLHVRGSDDAIGAIAAMVAELDVRAIDVPEGEFLDFDTAANSLAAWRAFRDRVV